MSSWTKLARVDSVITTQFSKGVSSCIKCHMQYIGKKHQCPGFVVSPSIKQIVDSQLPEEEVDAINEYIPKYGERLAAGFRMLQGGCFPTWNESSV